MKIAFIHFNSGFINRGGETFVHELANRLSSSNQVVVYQAGPPLSGSRYQTVRVGKFRHSGSLSALPATHIFRRLFLDPGKLREALFTLKVLPQILHFQPEVVIPLDSGWQALLVSLYCRFVRAKLVITGQSGPGWDDRFNLFVKPNLFVALTKRQLAWAGQATIWKQDLVCIPNGVDLVQFNPVGKKAKLNLEKPVIIMVAASIPDKRVEQGMRAIASFKSASLLLLGSGPLDERINNLGYELLGEKRFFHASIRHDRMPEFYRTANIFTLCSASSEAFGIVYLEAMASGLPIVATDDASRREIVAGAGIFVKNPDDTKEYAAAISTALKKNGKDASLKQASKFSWDNIAKNYEKLFAELINQP